MADIAELVGLLSKRVAELEEKNGALLEIITFQNRALKSCKAIDSAFSENIAAADVGISDMVTKPEQAA